MWKRWMRRPKKRKRKRRQKRRKERKIENEKWKVRYIYYFICDFWFFLKFIWRYISDMKNIKNCKLFSEAEEEFEEGQKRRKESLCAFDTLFKIDPMIMDTFTEEVALPRVEKNLSSHTKTALWPMAISCFGHFITVQVENCYGTARVISYVVLYHGYGTGSVKTAVSALKSINVSPVMLLRKCPSGISKR